MPLRSHLPVCIACVLPLLSAGCEQIDEFLGVKPAASAAASSSAAASGSAVGAASGSSDSPKLIGVDYLGKDAGQIRGAFEGMIQSELRALELTITREQATLQIYRPQGDDHAERFRLAGGQVASEGPISIPKRKADLEKGIFSLEDVALDKIAALTADAVTRIELKNGVASSVIVQRLLPYAEEVRIRVFVEGDTKGFVDYDAAGNFIEMSR